MDNMYLETFWFFVPNRIVWDHFVNQHGERPDPDSSTDYTTPIVGPGSYVPDPGDLWDNFGLPMGASLTTMGIAGKVSALPFRGYAMIYNEWFRDQDLQDSIYMSKGDGPELASDYQMMKINKTFDYFTGCRPAPQKGPAVEFPLGTSAPVSAANNIGISPLGYGSGFYPAMATATDGVFSLETQTGVKSINKTGANATVVEPIYWSDPKLMMSTADFAAGNVTADLSTASALTVNLFREAVTIQQVYELDMRGGTRFIEMVFNHYGATNPDFRLQRPEFLGYSKAPVNIHPVTQTSSTDATSPQGNLSAFGTVSSRNGFVKSFTEHGYVFGLVAVRADLSYQNTLDKHWTRATRFDYYYPIFANLGEQAVLQYEVGVDLTGVHTNDVFGYQERWAEYRFKTSKVTGLFRSTAPASLDAWHLAQQLPNFVPLDGSFIAEQAPVDRVIAVPSEPHFIFDCVVNNTSARVMPTYSVPGLTRI
jgi:hypothetical protein